MNEVEQLRQEVAQLRAEIDKVDDWANGVLHALIDVLPLLLKKHPDVAATVAPMWKNAARKFSEVTMKTGQAESFSETADLLEPKKMLYEMFALLGVWPPRA